MFNTIRCIIVLLAALLCSGNAHSKQPPMDDPASLYGSVARYSIYRKGKVIGKHSVSFALSGDTLLVDVDSKIRITVLKVPVFRFRYIAKETWTNGQLTTVTATTTENSDATTVSLTSSGNRSTLINAEGKELEVARLPFASNHWHPRVLDETNLFNTITGNHSVVDIESLGKTQLTINDQPIETTHYRYSGDIIADVWYDNQGRWVKLQFEGTDGSQISYVSDGFNLQ